MKKYLDEIDTRLKAQDEFQTMTLKLADDANKAEIEMLEGNDKLAAQRDYGLKQIEEFKKQMERLGILSKEQMKQLNILRAGVWVAFWEGLQPEKEKPLPQKDIDAISKALIGTPDLVRKDVEKAQDEINKTLTANKAMEEFSVWKLLGIDPESDEGAEQIAALQSFADNTIGILEDNFAQRTEIAQRERELIESRIDETQRELELEAALMQEGFANNVDLKRKELEELKKQRDAAFAEEQKALKAQQLIESVLQTVNLITASTEIFKSFSKIPIVGIPLAVAMIATMFGAFLAAKARAKQASKLAEGGSGTEKGLVTGKRHYQGGERFLDHIEVERGEAFGVLSRGATEKYGNIFHNMVSSFNKDAMPDFIAPAVSNSIRVENSGPNSRLDKVIKEQQRLNESLTKQSQLYSTGNKRIIKNGNKIRIVG
jgi:hypothetical protein